MPEAEVWSAGEFLDWITVPGGAICGTDMCDVCGECLVCECTHMCEFSVDGGHPWIVEERDLDAFLAAHAGARL